jgi:hypothetical protein
MPRKKRLSPETVQHLKLVQRLDQWFLQAGISNARHRADLTVDLADALLAAATIERSMQAMLKQNPGTKRGADRALRHAAIIDAYAFGELKHHIRSLERRWEPVLLEQLDKRAEG